jgi:predicted Zn-dependent protease
MISLSYKNIYFRLFFVSLSLIIFFLSFNACTVKRAPFEHGTIPKLAAPTPAAEEFGKTLFTDLQSDYKLDSDNQKLDELTEIFNHLTQAAGADQLPWHIYLFSGPEIVDVRAVHGNFIFVWSGLLDAVEDEDEIAGVLAFELAHVLAHHTDPVQFTIASDVFFSITELATSIGIMIASQGTVAIGGHGWMKWAYVEVTDLDPLDRIYSEELELEAASIALLIISRTNYSPKALLNFWSRIAEDETLHAKFKRISRSLSPQERAAMLETLIFELPEGNKQLAKKQAQ